MSPRLAAAVGNARHRAQLGWPLALLTLAVYAPNVGLARLALIAVGLFFLAQRLPGGTRTTTTNVPAKIPAPRPAKPTIQTAKAPAKTTRPRGTNGRYSK